MNLYIDFDKTLFDSTEFLDKLCLVLDKYNLPRELFAIYDSNFNPYEVLQKIKNLNQEIYHDLDQVFIKSENYIYDDVIPFFKYVKEKGYRVVIVTKGNKEYQKKKIESSKIDKYCDDIIITLEDKGNLNLDYKNGIFIDDNPNELHSILKNNPKEVIRIMRKNNHYNDIKLQESIKVIASLGELIKKE